MPFLSSSGISFLNIIRGGGAAGEAGALLLDLYPGASAAYSLRKLSSTYTGDAIRVRETASGLNNEQDIGFDGDGNLDTAALLSFTGAGDGFITKWYDQSGNANNYTQTGAANQPIIVFAGNLILANGKTAIRFNIDDAMSNTLPVTDNGAVYLSLVATIDSGQTDKQLFNIGGTSGVDNILISNTVGRTTPDSFAFVYRDSITAIETVSGIHPTGSPMLLTMGYSSSILQYINGVESTGSGVGESRVNFTDNYIGGRTPISFSVAGNFQEFIVYDSDQSSNRTAIESNINTNYNIYWDGSQTGLLDDYPNATAAYSLRALSSAYTGASIRVRRSSDNAEQDIGLLYDGSLDTETLLNFVGAGDGFVTTWYDQSGDGLDTTNPTASSQPQIVSSGSIITEGGLPTIDFNGDYLFNAGNFNYNGGVSIFSAFNSSVIAGGARIVSDDITGVQGNFIFYSDSTVSLNDNGSGFNNISYSATNGNQLRTLVFNDSTGDYNLLQNGSSLASGNLSGWTGPIAPSGASNIGVMASGNGVQTLVGTMQELIVWGNNQSSNRVGIETNINDYYSIYP